MFWDGPSRPTETELQEWERRRQRKLELAGVLWRAQLSGAPYWDRGAQKALAEGGEQAVKKHWEGIASMRPGYLEELEPYLDETWHLTPQEFWRAWCDRPGVYVSEAHKIASSTPEPKGA